MSIVGTFRATGWLCCACVLLSGCARFGWNSAARERGAIDEDASFIASPLNKPAPLKPATAAKPATAENATASNDEARLPPIVNAENVKLTSTTPQATPPAAKPAAPANLERVALEAEIRTRMRALPDTTPEQMQEFERSLTDLQGPLAMQQLRQLNGIVQLRQRQAEVAAKPAVEPAPTAPVQTTVTPAPAAIATKPAPVEAKPTETEIPAETPLAQPDKMVVPASAQTPVESTPRSVAERLQQAKERSNAQKRSGIFDGKVKTSLHEATQATSDELALHTSHKPTDKDITPQDSPSDEPDEPALSWREHLSVAIDELKAELQRTDLTSEERVQQETHLRVMCLLAEQTDAALKEIPGLDPNQQDYWRCQLHSLQVSLATDGTPVKGRRATLALRPLREAVDHLASQATLDVRNVALCKEVTIWGNYREFEKYEFKPDQEVLLYFEVENFAVTESAQGYASEFVSSYEVFDPAGRRVAEQQLPVAQETCKNRRRDYFVRYHLHIPKQLSAGEYTLQLTVEDQKGHKFGQTSVKFKVI